MGVYKALWLRLQTLDLFSLPAAPFVEMLKIPRHQVSDEQYPSRGFIGSFPVLSS